MSGARTQRSAEGTVFDRIYLLCPSGHEVVSTPIGTRLGKRLLAGDYAGESCGYGKCGWSA